MKVAHIVPTSMLDLVKDDDYHLVLAEQVMRDDDYATFYREQRKRGAFVILDNGAYEFGRTPSLDTLLEAAEYIQPSEIVLPDSMHGPDCAKETVTMAKEGWDRLAAEGWKHFMVVPHGNTWDEWLDCHRQLMHIPNVRCVGIAEKDALKVAPDGRREALIGLVCAQKFGYMSIHLLGMMESMSDVMGSLTRCNVRGIDGSKMTVWGLAGLSVYPASQPLPSYPGRPEHYFDMVRPVQSTIALSRRNMVRWTKFAANERARLPRHETSR